MIVVGNLLTYGVEGKKIAELKSYLQQNVAYRYVEDLKGFVQIKRAVLRKVEELNAKYKHTVPVEFKGNVDEKYNSGVLSFHRPGASHSILSMSVLYVRQYEEGGAA